MSIEFHVYEILGVHPGSADEEIKARHRALSRQYHPDRPDGGDDQKFHDVQVAYRMVKDGPARRLLATKLKGLGEKCPSCDGRGYTRRQKKLTQMIKDPCASCGACGYLPR